MRKQSGRVERTFANTYIHTDICTHWANFNFTVYTQCLGIHKYFNMCTYVELPVLEHHKRISVVAMIIYNSTSQLLTICILSKQYDFICMYICTHLYYRITVYIMPQLIYVKFVLCENHGDYLLWSHILWLINAIKSWIMFAILHLHINKIIQKQHGRKHWLTKSNYVEKMSPVRTPELLMNIYAVAHAHTSLLTPAKHTYNSLVCKWVGNAIMQIRIPLYLFNACITAHE